MAMDFGDVAHLRVDNGDGFFDTPDGFTIAAWVLLEEPLRALDENEIIELIQAR
jgi:hypothetical protein